MRRITIEQKLHEWVMSLDFLNIRQFGHTLHINNMLFSYCLRCLYRPIFYLYSDLPSTIAQYKGKKESMKEGSKEGKKEGKKEGRKEGTMLVLCYSVLLIMLFDDHDMTTDHEATGRTRDDGRRRRRTHDGQNDGWTTDGRRMTTTTNA